MLAPKPQYIRRKVGQVSPVPKRPVHPPETDIRKRVGSVAALYEHAMLIEDEAVSATQQR